MWLPFLSKTPSSSPAVHTVDTLAPSVTPETLVLLSSKGETVVASIQGRGSSLKTSLLVQAQQAAKIIAADRVLNLFI